MTLLWRTGSLSPISVFETHDIVEMIGRDLEEATIRDGDHAVELAGCHVKDITGGHPNRLQVGDVRTRHHVQLTVENPKLADKLERAAISTSTVFITQSGVPKLSNISCNTCATSHATTT